MNVESSLFYTEEAQTMFPQHFTGITRKHNTPEIFEPTKFF